MLPTAEKNIRLIRYRHKVLLGLILVLTLCYGCAGNMGNLQPHEEVTALFQNFEWVEGYRYYHNSYGLLSRRTYAVIGIKQPYTVQSRQWEQVKNMAELTSVINDTIGTSQKAPQGFKIVNPRGETIGVWYSSIFGSSVRFNDDSQIVPMLGPEARRPSRI